MSSTNVVNSSLADPNGDLNSYQYTVLAANDLMLARQRFFASAVQGIADVVILTTFTHLLIRALVLLPARRRSLPGWCLVIQMTSGFIYGCLAMTTYAPVGLGCNQITLTASFFMSLSSMLTTTCLLCQAYYANRRDVRIKYIGVPLVLASNISWISIFFDSHSENTDEIGCVLHYPLYLPLLRGIVDITVNLLLSSAFIYTIHQQYVKFGSSCWYKLRKEGIQYSLGVIISNLTCAIITTADILGDTSQVVFLLDWLIVSALLTRQHERMRKAGRELASTINSGKSQNTGVSSGSPTNSGQHAAPSSSTSGAYTNPVVLLGRRLPGGF